MVVLAIVIPGPGRAAFQQENRKGVEDNLLQVVRALEEHHAKAFSYPASLMILERVRNPLGGVPIYDFSAGILRFAPYHYVLASDGQSYDLFSVGPDPKPYTKDDIRPVLPDSLRSKSGFRPAP